MTEKKALVVEGGAMRGVFASGVLDSFMEQDYRPFHFVIGVSAGASTLVGYLSNQSFRSYRIITELATSKQFYNPIRFLRGGNLIEVRWLFEEANKRYPVDEKRLFSSIPFFAGATNVKTGQADYYQVTQDNFVTALEASSALPLVYKKTPYFAGESYTDGGVADSIPVQEAYRRGARDVTVILSRPLSYTMSKPKSEWMTKKLFSRYPQVANSIVQRAEKYNASLQFIHHPPKDATIRVIAPPENFSVKRLTMKKPILHQGYQMGIDAGRAYLRSIENGND